MSTLRSALDELGSAQVHRMCDEQLEADLLEIQRARDILDAEGARRLAEVERRRLFQRDGHLSTAAWLADRARMSFGAAKREVRTALALEEMPATRAALSEGELSGSAVRVLVAAHETNPREFPGSEHRLVDKARDVSVGELSAIVGEWSRDMDEASGERERRLRERRSFTIAPTPSGSWRVRGELDPETGHTVHTAMRSVIDAEVRVGADLRTTEQRGADAIGEICRRHLDSADRPFIGGERPHVTVMLDLDSLEGRQGGRCELEDAGPISCETARRIACDASVTRVITRGRSEPLEVGRRTPVVSTALRKAVAVRDGNCRFPGCDRPQSWCDAHHVVHWADGGRTDLSNLILLCRPHHRLVHQGFMLDMSETRLTFRRPDGTIIEDRAPP